MALLSVAFLAIAFIFLFKLIGEIRARRTNLPPSPSKLPIIGNLHQLGTLPHRSLLSLAEKHGPLMLLHLGQIPTLVVTSAEIAKEIMTTHDHIFASRPSITAARELLYGCSDVAFSPFGDYWRQVRKICVLELLSPKRVKYFRSLMEEEVGLMIKRISQSSSKGATINLTEELLTLTSGTVSRVALGKKYEGEEQKNKFADLAKELVELLGVLCVGDFFPSFAWVDVVIGTVGRLKKNSREVDVFLDQVIEHHLILAKMKEGDGKEQKDLVDVLLHLQKDSTLDIQLTRNNLKAIILDMFAAGTDTTATTLEWAMAELLKHPDVMEKAQAEIRKIVGKEEKVKEGDIHQFHYLKLIIKETLRLHPATPLLLPREAATNVTVNGYHIPAKTRVFVNAWAIGRDPKSWEKAEEFLPERFINIPIEFKGQDFQFIPFGAGRRSCPGYLFGINFVELALADLLYWFDWELPPGQTPKNLDMTEALGLVVHLKKPLYLRPKRHISKDDY